MRLQVLFVALVFGGASNPKTGRDVDSGRKKAGENSSVTVVLRYTNQSVVSCTESTQQYRRRHLSCRSRKRWDRSAATLEFRPLPDENRKILGSDRREAFSIRLPHENRPSEIRVEMQKGPWRITWQEASKTIRAEIEDADNYILVSQLNGACKTGSWRCWLDTKSTEKKLEFIRARKGKPL